MKLTTLLATVVTVLAACSTANLIPQEITRQKVIQTENTGWSGPTRLGNSHSDGFTIIKQGEDICRAGSRQWAGTVDVSDDKSLFYWFFESRRQTAEDPVIIWLSGGPGISSMMGLFTELGPCLVEEQHRVNETTFNKHSWTNFANVLFIDQPAGVGFSTARNGNSGPDNMKDAAVDINTFLRVFFSDMFPQFSTRTLHFAGESFGGHWVPSFVSQISRHQKLNVPGTFGLQFDSILLFDAVISYIASADLAMYDHFCAPGSRVKLNATACRAMEETMPECDKLHRLCVETYDANVCEAAGQFCAETHAKWYYDFGPGMPDPYDDRFLCKDGTFACGNFDMSFVDYLNTSKVQKALGFDEAVAYKPFNASVNLAWGVTGAVYVPTIREMTYILNDTPTRVLVINGNNDIIVDTEGQKRVFDSLVPWKRQAAFRVRRFDDWFWSSENGTRIKGGQTKSAGKLSFLTVDEAGHSASGNQREAISFAVRCWTTGGDGDDCPALGTG